MNRAHQKAVVAPAEQRIYSQGVFHGSRFTDTKTPINSRLSISNDIISLAERNKPVQSLENFVEDVKKKKEVQGRGKKKARGKMHDDVDHKKEEF